MFQSEAENDLFRVCSFLENISFQSFFHTLLLPLYPYTHMCVRESVRVHEHACVCVCRCVKLFTQTAIPSLQTRTKTRTYFRVHMGSEREVGQGSEGEVMGGVRGK